MKQKKSRTQIDDNLKVLLEGLHKKLDSQQIVHVTNNFTSNTTINHNEQITNNTLNLVSFGKETSDWILKHPDPIEYARKTIFNKDREKDLVDGIVEFIARKHFNEEFPENMNVKKTNKKDRVMKVADGGSWKAMTSDEAMQIMINSLRKDVVAWLEEFEDHVTKNRKQFALERFDKDINYPLGWNINSDMFPVMAHDYERDEEEERHARRQEKKINLLVHDAVCSKTKEMILPDCKYE